MSDQSIQLTEELYALIGLLPRWNHQTAKMQLPQNGVYVFFERGETLQWRGTVKERMVRVGTHRKNGRFKDRIRQHYGNARSLGGNKNGSVFRKHLGGALLRRANPHDDRLREWVKQGGLSFAEVEEMVSCVLRENFTFSCFRVDQQVERLALEKGLIALLAQHPLGQPSADLLGRYAASDEIGRSGLWNTQHIDARPLTAGEFHRLEQLVKASLVERGV